MPIETVVSSMLMFNYVLTYDVPRDYLEYLMPLFCTASTLSTHNLFRAVYIGYLNQKFMSSFDHQVHLIREHHILKL
ncbi:hypothetical protein WICANDRAFT_98314 [Wickerhamomyces anomalus NRRL Y-366-8]|uniref:Uncharacterized protein n=1 Tax=Wickerhamomyces anomalus (strain ATCC 58044 / CBS 1984 / NCYC 433 / NRRL Y-366-8) TaxID=683960 RepID=A0A1E3NU87_WICAA|nr:uncharacterized protein WICANDRAFT_98314 [Wickerhamomyces anomalus NRRL Y-366-8]ODQ56644.1 hypothetical protein WICANDRAFT_98314 [Wickerhamomyces anomalus NRRL Y-366-8]